MNPQTGEIKGFQTWKDANAEGYTIRLKRKPRSNCKKCYGRGHIGINDQGKYVPCSCTQ